MYGVNNSIQQQLAQNRMNQLETQYNNMFPQQYMQQPMQSMQMQQQMQVPQYQQQNVQTLKGRPVSNIDEAKASMIDLDGSLFVFPDVANGCIYTKQIMLDGTAEFKTYKIVGEQKPKQTNDEYVLRSEFQKQLQCINAELKRLRGTENEHDEYVSE
jgi:hypothetical protein